MIGPGTGVRVYFACGVTDMREGHRGPVGADAGRFAPEADQWRSVCLPRAQG
jgi:hypothetical protein